MRKRFSFEHRAHLRTLPTAVVATDKYTSESSILSSSSQRIDYDDEYNVLGDETDDAVGVTTPSAPGLGSVLSESSLTSVEHAISGRNNGKAAKKSHTFLRSLRLKSLLLPGSKKPKTTPTVAGSQTSLASSCAEPTRSKTSSKAGSVLKKFLNMRKNRKRSKAATTATTADVNVASDNRVTPEGATTNLSQSEKSLASGSHPQTNTDTDVGNQSEPLPRKLSPQRCATTTVLERGDEVHIVTRSAQKSTPQTDRYTASGTTLDTAPTTTTPIAASTTTTTTSTPDSRVAAACDQLPLATTTAVPYNISEVEISKLLVATGASTTKPHRNVPHSASHGAAVCTGAIKKTVTTTTQHKTQRRDFYVSRPTHPANAEQTPCSEVAEATTVGQMLHRSGSIERGRRYPRPTGGGPTGGGGGTGGGADDVAGIAVAVQHLVNEVPQQPTGGNSVENTNLSGSIVEYCSDQIGAVESDPPAEEDTADVLKDGEVASGKVVDRRAGQKVRSTRRTATSNATVLTTQPSSTSFALVSKETIIPILIESNITTTTSTSHHTTISTSLTTTSSSVPSNDPTTSIQCFRAMPEKSDSAQRLRQRHNTRIANVDARRSGTFLSGESYTEIVGDDDDEDADVDEDEDDSIVSGSCMSLYNELSQHEQQQQQPRVVRAKLNSYVDR